MPAGGVFVEPFEEAEGAAFAAGTARRREVEQVGEEFALVAGNAIREVQGTGVLADCAVPVLAWNEGWKREDRGLTKNVNRQELRVLVRLNDQPGNVLEADWAFFVLPDPAHDVLNGVKALFDVVVTEKGAESDRLPEVPDSFTDGGFVWLAGFHGCESRGLFVIVRRSLAPEPHWRAVVEEPHQGSVVRAGPAQLNGLIEQVWAVGVDRKAARREGKSMSLVRRAGCWAELGGRGAEKPAGRA